MDVSFVIPCYEEEAALAVFAGMLDQIRADEIIFVDDGSTDGTAAALGVLAQADDRVEIVTHEHNRGVGAAMRSGIAQTRGATVVVYDVDRTYPLGDADLLVGLVATGVDVAGATPYDNTPGERDGTQAHGAWQDVPWWRRALSGSAARAYRLVLGRRARGITVFTCAFRAYRGEVIRKLAFRSDGFPAAAEILGRLVLAGAQIKELASPLRARTEGQSKMRVLRATRGHLGNLGRLLWARLRGGQAEQ